MPSREFTITVNSFPSPTIYFSFFAKHRNFIETFVSRNLGTYFVVNLVRSVLYIVFLLTSIIIFHTKRKIAHKLSDKLS